MEGENNFMPPPEKKLYKARIVCSCGKEMGEKDGFEEEGITTHGSCEECKAKAKAELEAYLKEHPPKKE